MASAFPRPQRPTGILRALPYDAESSDETLQSAYRKLLHSLRALNTDDEAWFYVGMAQKPIHEVLHMLNRLVQPHHWRLLCEPAGDICSSHYSPAGDDVVHKYWCVLSAPFVEPPEKILRRGFRGFHYTEDLW